MQYRTDRQPQRKQGTTRQTDPVSEGQRRGPAPLLAQQRGRGRGGANRRRGGGSRPHKHADAPIDTPATPRPTRPAAAAPQPKALTLPAHITVRDLAEMMGRSPIDLIKELMNAGMMANINQLLDRDSATIVAEDMGYTIQQEEVAAPEPEEVVQTEVVRSAPKRIYTEEEQAQLRQRPPVVTILGHVDHGKTSLLDVIRQTNVQAGEAGGITQAIGAYQIRVNDKLITFVDTPGHAAFTAMRARGASVTDIAVLVVAADDGVQPQTREAIDHARAAQVPIVVALNKMDLASANPDHALQQLAELKLVPEDWGGDTIVVPVSARTHLGIETLLDMILLVAEIADLKADPRAPAEGVVLEGKLDRSRGPMATLLVQEGTLKEGDALVVGQTYGKIRAMFNHLGKPIKRAGPSTPAVVMGLKDVPNASDRFVAAESEREAREEAERRQQTAQSAVSGSKQALTLEGIFAQAQAGSVQALNLVLKADVQGSIEPIRNSLEKLKVGDLVVKFVHEGVGKIAESDVMLASASKAIVVGFNVIADPSALRLAETEHIDIRTYDIIYRLIEDVQLALSGMLEPEYENVVKGTAVVRQVFRVRRQGAIAGSQVTDGTALRNARVRVLRNGQELVDSTVASLKRFAEDVREVRSGMECGIGIEGFEDLTEGDTIEFYVREVVKR
jgi:translation initiation factor IF-2